MSSASLGSAVAMRRAGQLLLCALVACGEPADRDPDQVALPSYAGMPGGSRWKDGVIRYQLTSDFSSDPAMMLAWQDAIDTFTDLTRLEFEVQTDLSQPTIVYQPDPRYLADHGCYINSTLARPNGK